MFQNVESYESYSAALKTFKKANRNLLTNCFFYSGKVREWIADGRLSLYISDGCLLLSKDEKSFYEIYYYIREDAEFPSLRLDKPASVKLIYRENHSPAYLPRQEEQLVQAGFLPQTKVYQIVCTPLKQKNDIDRLYDICLERQANQSFRLEFFDGENFSEILHLWQDTLSEYDIPFFSDRDIEKMAQEHEIPLIIDAACKKIVAAAHAEYSGKTAQIRRVCAHPSYRGKGLGERVLLETVRACANHACDTAYGYIHEDNTVSWNLHNKIFIKSGLVTKPYLLCPSD